MLLIMKRIVAREKPSPTVGQLGPVTAESVHPHTGAARLPSLKGLQMPPSGIEEIDRQTSEGTGKRREGGKEKETQGNTHTHKRAPTKGGETVPTARLARCAAS